MAKKKLSAEVAEKYTLKGDLAGRHHFNGFGVYDMCTLTLAEADELVARGFEWLVPKKTSSAAPANDNAPS